MCVGEEGGGGPEVRFGCVLGGGQGGRRAGGRRGGGGRAGGRGGGGRAGGGRGGGGRRAGGRVCVWGGAEIVDMHAPLLHGNV